MIIKTIFIVILIVSVTSAAPALTSAYTFQDSSVTDSIKQPVPDYSNVNVLVESEWGTSDKTENVDVFLKKEKGKYTEIVMKKSNHQECIVELIPGLKVKIINRKTGKILKTIKP